MLLDLPRELLLLITHFLPLNDAACLFRCHSRCTFLFSEEGWHSRYRHTVANTRYAQTPKPSSVTWREWYRVALQRLMIRSHDSRRVLMNTDVRPWYITQSMVVDIAGHTYLLTPRLTCISKLPLTCVGSILYHLLEHYIVIDDQAQLCLVSNIFPQIILHREVKHAAYVKESSNLFSLIIVATNEEVYYAKHLTLSTLENITWTPLTKKWDSSIICLGARLKRRMLLISLITNEGCYFCNIIERDEMDYHINLHARNMGLSYLIEDTHRLEVRNNELFIKSELKGKESYGLCELLYTNGRTQIRSSNGLISDGYNFLNADAHKVSYYIVPQGVKL